MKLTAQRKKLFRLADSRRKGPRRLARLKRRDVISGDASALWKVKADK